jgi:hypothetical protein
MDQETTRTIQATELRNKYSVAVENSYSLYCESEEIAAFLVLDICRLKNSTEEKDKRKLKEKENLLAQVKINMNFILDKILLLSKEKNEFLSDIYTSSKIMDVENQLTDLTPWLNDLSREVESQASQALTVAKITAEVNQIVRT